MPGADLHSHTTASDGSLTPTQLVQLAQSVGLEALAITDHDTIDGIAEALSASSDLDLEIIPGIELAVTSDTGRFHMLGLFIDLENPILNSRLTELKENRLHRNEQMVARLNELGLPLTMEEVVAESGGGEIGRPHFAAAMVKRGFATSLQDAFNTYLADSAAAHVPKEKITPEEGIALIHAAGGIATIAHPNSLKLDNEALYSLMVRLKSEGLDAVECYYNLHTPDRNAELAIMAARAGLKSTGGSDFHGTPKPNVRLGVVIGDQPLPMEVVDDLRR